MEEQDAVKNRRTYVMVVDLKDRVANSEDLNDWLQDGWEIVSVRRVDGDAEQSIAILITVESTIDPGGVAKFRKARGDRRSGRGAYPTNRGLVPFVDFGFDGLTRAGRLESSVNRLN